MGLFNRARDTADRLELRAALTSPPAPATGRRKKGADAPQERPFAPTRIEFAFVKVRPDPLPDAVGRIRTVVDLAADTKATTTMLGTTVLVLFAYPVTHRRTDELATFIAAVQGALGADAAVVHGIEECPCGTYGGTRARVFGPILPQQLTYLKRLAEIAYGITMKV